MTCLLTGGSGTLGQELQKHIECYAPKRDLLDIANPEDSVLLNSFTGRDVLYKHDLIVHCAAFTDLNRAEKEKELAYQTNVIGTKNLASLGIPILYISTSYVFDGEKGDYDETAMPNPQNFYAFTKLLGEYEARACHGSVVIRCLFKPRPFKHDVACIDQLSSGMYADEIAPEIALAIKMFRKLPPTVHIGARRKSTYELARESRPDVRKCRIADIKSVKLPRDTSLDCSRWLKLKEALCK